MPISPARVAAYEILLRIEAEDSYASELLHSRRYALLSTADHGLATELVMGVLRWRSLLDLRIAVDSSQKLSRLDLEVLTPLRLGCYQLLFLHRIPQHAAVNESVDLVKRARKRSAVPFANAVLRKLANYKSPLPAIDTATNVSALSDASAHPSWLVRRWIENYGLVAARNICEYDQRPPVASIRVCDPAAEEELQSESVKLEFGKILSSARRVTSSDVTQTKAFRNGRVMIQDEGSQLVALLVGHGSSFLDCCAAPGGKTRVMAQQNPSAAIIAADVYPARANLTRKLVKETNVSVIAADARQLPLADSFDRVLVDVPCSGTGTLARNPEIKWRLRPPQNNDGDLADLQQRQTAILHSAMQRVGPRGKLIYSTCSLEPEENEQVVERAMATNQTFRLIDCQSELQQLKKDGELTWANLPSLTRGPYLRTIPGVHPCDGFFAAMLEKK